MPDSWMAIGEERDILPGRLERVGTAPIGVGEQWGSCSSLVLFLRFELDSLSMFSFLLQTPTSGKCVVLC